MTTNRSSIELEIPSSMSEQGKINVQSKIKRHPGVILKEGPPCPPVGASAPKAAKLIRKYVSGIFVIVLLLSLLVGLKYVWIWKLKSLLINACVKIGGILGMADPKSFLVKAHEEVAQLAAAIVAIGKVCGGTDDILALVRMFGFLNFLNLVIVLSPVFSKDVLKYWT